MSRAFLQACKDKNYNLIPPMVMDEWQLAFTPEEINKGLKKITIPENPQFHVRYTNHGLKAQVAVIGTNIGLELQLINGRWLLEK